MAKSRNGAYIPLILAKELARKRCAIKSLSDMPEITFRGKTACVWAVLLRLGSFLRRTGACFGRASECPECALVSPDERYGPGYDKLWIHSISLLQKKSEVRDADLH